MIKSIQFNADLRIFKKDEKIDFFPGINLLVGDQGSGKSTLIENIRVHCTPTGKMGKIKPNTTITVDNMSNIRTYEFDFEKENVRTASTFNTHQSMGYQVQARFLSHGQSVMTLLSALKQIKEPSLVILDEPDMALSLRSIYQLCAIFAHIVNVGGQVIASVHNPALIESQEKVLSMEHKCWMNSSEFLSAQKLPR